MPAVPTIRLNNGVEIPQLGFGVFQIEPEQTREATLMALEVGYRHIDTAEMYGNEKQVGEAVRDSDVPRDEVFVTSKLDNGFHAFDDALHAFDQTLKALEFDYVDLFLIHWPLPKVGNYVDTWRALEEIYRSGRARAIGVSNFQPHHLRRLQDETEITPAVNQIEVHPYLVQDEVRAYDAERGIATEAYSPLAQGLVLDDPTIVGIAERRGAPDDRSATAVPRSGCHPCPPRAAGGAPDPRSPLGRRCRGGMGLGTCAGARPVRGAQHVRGAMADHRADRPRPGASDLRRPPAAHRRRQHCAGGRWADPPPCRSPVRHRRKHLAQPGVSLSLGDRGAPPNPGLSPGQALC